MRKRSRRRLWVFRRRYRVFVSYPHPELHKRARWLVTRLRCRGYDVRWQENWLPPGADWEAELEREIRTYDVVIALVSNATSRATTQRKEISVARDQRTLLPVLIGHAVLQGKGQRIHAITVKGERGWSKLYDALDQRLEAKFAMKKVRSVRGHSTPAQAPPAPSRSVALPLALIDTHSAPWHDAIDSDPYLRQVFDRVVSQLNVCLLLPRNRPVAHTIVGHVRRVLEHLDGLCRGPFAQQIEPAGVPTLPEQFLVATIATLAHNIASLPELPMQLVSHPSRVEYNEGCREFLRRTEWAYAFLGHGLDSRGRRLLEIAMHLGFEMARDTAYWVEGAGKLDPHDRFLRAMARNLRRADVMDVSHRVVRDLVHQLFDHFGYSDGFRCFLLHSFLPGQPGLLEGHARLEGNSLILPFPTFESGVGLSGKRDPILSVLPLAQSLVFELTRHSLYRIDTSRGFETDTPLRVVKELVRTSLTRERADTLTWAFFPLSLIEPLSDTEAAIRAASLLPPLVDFIHRSDPKYPHQSAHTTTQVSELLHRIPLLRRRSQALRRVCDLAREQIDAGPAHRIALESKALDLWSGPRRMANVTSTADEIVLLGSSRPAAYWIAERLRRNPSCILHMLHCTRYCVWRRSYDSAERPQELASVDVAADAAAKIKQAIRARKGRPPKCLDAPPLNVSRLNQIVRKAKHQRREVELVLGTRGFQRPSQGGVEMEFVTIAGSEMILVWCRQKGVRLRLVTSEDALKYPDRHPPSDASASTFSMTYSQGDPGHEDESLPLSLVDVITTEERGYTPAEAQALIERHMTRPIRDRSDERQPS
jgi:hypothetical protein